MKRYPLTYLVPMLLVSGGLIVAAVSPALAGADHIRAAGPLIRYADAVPMGASARVDAIYDAAGRSVITLHLWGMLPDQTYGAHAHNKPCGATGSAAGSHYQSLPDPEQPSVNPAYANSVNEIWLDVHTDADGNGSAQTKVGWQFAPDRRAHSVIVHAEPTHTGETDSGTAGARLACLTVAF
jgi:Cu-Zn family superoxide dismutase